MIGDQKDVFKRAYGNLLGVLMTKVDLGLILTFSQFYDPMLHCFTFHDFLLAPTLDELDHLIHIPISYQIPYMGDVELPEVALVSQALHLEKSLVEANLCTKEMLEVLLRSLFLRRPFYLLVVEVGMPYMMCLISENVATKEKKLERLKVHKSMMHSIWRTHWGDRDFGDKRSCVGQATT